MAFDSSSCHSIFLPLFLCFLCFPPTLESPQPRSWSQDMSASRAADSQGNSQIPTFLSVGS